MKILYMVYFINLLGMMIDSGLLEIEKQLVKITVELGKIKREIPRNEAIIMAHLHFIPEITQEELHTISGLSSGSISKILNKFVNQKLLAREINPKNSQHIYHRVESNTKISDLSSGIIEAKKVIDKDKVFYQNISAEIEKVELQKELGFEFFRSRIQELIQSTLLMDWIINKIFNTPTSTKPIELYKPISSPQSKALSPSFTLGKQLQPYESQTFEYLKTNQRLRYYPEVTATILALFYLKKELIENQIQQITGFSSGAISQSLKILERDRYIHKQFPRKRPYRFILDSIPSSMIKIFQKGIAGILDYKNEFYTLNEVLAKLPNSSKNSGFFERISKVVIGILSIIPKLESIFEEVNRIINIS